LFADSIVHKILAADEGSKNDVREHIKMARKVEIKNTFGTIENVL